ncbi:MFS transporter [Crenalkalicoccus roseus]|uniref:MFS transporter n=1 Tax=Crenalkalicoccus roseus TaxID=1485588 RepID=UPI0010808817|nr:MFS transporter [Crenalkalicoccus roseus]
MSPSRSAAWRFALLFALQFAAIGVMLPFLPAVLAGHGLAPAEVAAVLAAGSAVRLLAAPLIGRAADALGDARAVLVAAALLAGATAAGFGLAQAFLALLLVSLAHSLAMAPVIPLTDALCLGASRRLGFDYGRVRAAGSVAFILAAVAAGQLAAAAGMASVVWLFVLCLFATGLAALALPAAPPPPRGGGGFRAPFAEPGFRWLLPLSALIQGSHALYYGFATIHWQAAGLSLAVIGLLWAEGVVAEVALFLWGKRLADRLGAPGLAALAAAAGVLRWAVTAETTWLPALAAVQLLHAATFGAQHLAAMRVLARQPPARAATAQTLHASLGVGLASGLLMLAAGPLYAAFGGAAFWAMAALCALALPLAAGLRRALPAG